MFLVGVLGVKASGAVATVEEALTIMHFYMSLEREGLCEIFKIMAATCSKNTPRPSKSHILGNPIEMNCHYARLHGLFCVSNNLANRIYGL